MPGFFNSQKEEEEAKGPNNVKFSENEGKKGEIADGPHGAESYFVKIEIRNLKGGWAYEINF